MTLRQPTVSDEMRARLDVREKRKQEFLNKLFIDYENKEVKKEEIERKQKLIKEAEIYKKELEFQLLDDDKENIENKADQLNLLTEINIKQDVIIDLLAKLDSALINLNNLIDD